MYKIEIKGRIYTLTAAELRRVRVPFTVLL
jgi:hypothetical protein